MNARIGIARMVPWMCALALLIPAAPGAPVQSTDSATDSKAAPAPTVTVLRADEDGLDVSLQLSTVDIEPRETPINVFLQAGWSGAAYCGAPGEPMIPVVRRAFIAPIGATIHLDVETGEATSFDLAQEGYTTTLMPAQESGPDSRDLRIKTFDYNPAAYARDAELPEVRARFEEIGEYRGRQMYMLELRPVAYNAARNTLTVWSDLTVHLTFEGGSAPGNLPAWRSIGDEVLNPPPGVDMRGSLNYLILAPVDYAGSAPLNQFVNAKTTYGYNVTVYTVPVGATTTSIKSYIQSLWGTANEPDYILIAADTPCSFNPLNELEYTMLPATSSTIPNYVGSGATKAATDLYYACMGGASDWYPDIRIGRVPVSNLAELQSIVDKTLYIMNGAFENPNYLKRAVFMAGYDYGCGDQAAHNYVITNYLEPAGFTNIKVYVPLGGTPEDLTNAINTGCLYAVYYGHSDFFHWWEPEYWVEDVHALENTNRYPFIFNFTCRVGCFDYPAQETFSESWIRSYNANNEPTGGVIFIGATRQIYHPTGLWEGAFFLEKKLFDKLYDENIRVVGDVWQSTIAALIVQFGASDPMCRDYSEMFVVLGDPSLKIAEPASFTLTADPTVVSHCPPPTQPAVFEIDAVPQPNFNSQVHLTVQGVPSGATAHFSINDAVPPFTSTLTINNVPSGVHNMTVNGSAPGGVGQVVPIRAVYSTSAPGAVTPISPFNEHDVSLTPTMTWGAVNNAFQYRLQISKDILFETIEYEAVCTETSHVVTEPLEEGVMYLWRCWAINACGTSTDAPLAFFWTLTVPKYFTEVFASEPFDLSNKTIQLTPDGSGFFYSMCIESATALPTDPTGGTTLALYNDNSIAVTPASPVSFYGANYNSFFVNSNGNITFGQGDTTWNETLEAHMSKKRIAGVFDDLKPNVGGTVSWKQTADRVAVTYLNVPGQGFSGTVTFQIEMFKADGAIHITWLGVNSNSCIIGLSQGNGIPSNYVEMDLSAAESCGPPCFGDITGDLQINLADLAHLLGHYGQTGVTYWEGDLTGDGNVTLADLAELLSLYGHPCP